MQHSDSECDADTRTIHHEENTYPGTLFPASKVLEADVETWGMEKWGMIWLGTNDKPAHFVMDLGCQEFFQQILLRNCHNAAYRDRSTKEIR